MRYLLIVLLSFVSMSVFADDIHTVYISSANPKLEEGKFVQVALKKANVSIVTCLSNGTSFSVDSEAIDFLNLKPGDMFVEEYAQCKNVTCSEKTPLLTDQFVITKEQDKYSSMPATNQIHLVDSYGDTCNPLDGVNVAQRIKGRMIHVKN